MISRALLLICFFVLLIYFKEFLFNFFTIAVYIQKNSMAFFTATNVHLQYWLSMNRACRVCVCAPIVSSHQQSSRLKWRGPNSNDSWKEKSNTQPSSRISRLLIVGMSRSIRHLEEDSRRLETKSISSGATTQCTMTVVFWLSWRLPLFTVLQI
jgi:hypothetical protein